MSNQSLHVALYYVIRTFKKKAVVFVKFLPPRICHSRNVAVENYEGH